MVSFISFFTYIVVMCHFYDIVKEVISGKFYVRYYQGAQNSSIEKQSPGGVTLKGVLKNFTKFTGKHLCQSVFFNKETLLKKRLWHRYFPVDFVKFLRTPFFIEHLWWLVLDIPEITGIVIAFFVRQGILDKPGNVKGFFH